MTGLWVTAGIAATILVLLLIVRILIGKLWPYSEGS